MKQRIQTWLIMVLIFSLLFSIGTYAAEDDLNSMIQASARSLKNSFESKEKNILSDEKILPAGNSASDWVAMVLAFAGESDAYENYLNRMEDYVAEQYQTQGYLDAVKATEYHRISLTMLALGGDPANIQTDNEKINLVADGTWSFYGGSPGEQGCNGLIYALLTLEAKDNFLSEEHESFREEMINELLAHQDADGGFALNTSFGADIDMTAMAVQALAPYQEQTNVKEATEKALQWISEKIFETTASESVSQTLLALCAMGIDPDNDTRFIKDNQTLLDELNRFRTEDGMYQHELQDETSNLVATYQALLALEAVQKLHTEGTWIFDFETYEFPENINVSEKNSAVIMIPLLVMAVVVVVTVVILKKRKINKMHIGRVKKCMIK